jgi:hypothetical protein
LKNKKNVAEKKKKQQQKIGYAGTAPLRPVTCTRCHTIKIDQLFYYLGVLKKKSVEDLEYLDDLKKKPITQQNHHREGEGIFF